MTSKAILRTLLFAVACTASVSSPLAAAELAGSRPNIIFCMTDDQGYGDAGFMGHPVLQTPELDRMAAAGIRMHRFYTPSPVCSPTRAGVLTGRHPTRLGVFRWGNALRPQERTVAKLLRDAGYQTAFFGKWHLGSVRKDRPTSPGGHGFDHWYAAPNFYMNDPWMSRNGEPVQLKGEGSMVTVEAALDYIRDAAAEDEPFLVFIWFGSPHTPHQATDELKELYRGLPEQLQNYYGEITGIDRAMGRLRKELRDLKINDKTLLMFTSDNGGRPRDGADHRGLRGQKGDLWEGGIRVPAVIEWTDHVDRAVSSVPAGGVDLMPTFLELAGVSPPDDRPLDGISLVPLLQGKYERRPQPLGFWDYPKPETRGMASDEIVRELKKVLEAGGEGEVNEGVLHEPGKWEELDDYPGRAVWMDNRWKLHRTQDQKYLLFDIVDDFGEDKNLIDEHPERAEKMKRQLRRWEDSVIKSVRGKDYQH